MLICSLIAPPGGLSVDMAGNLFSAWGGRELTWLHPREAAEFEIAAMPENRWQVWQDLQEMHVDLVVQPKAGRRKKLLLADMDSTMIQQECIDELADLAGVGTQVKGITAKAMNGELDFEQALRARVALLEGQPTSIIDQALKTRIFFTAGGAELLATMKANGAYTALVSGGFTAFTQPVSQHLGFHEHHANQLLVDHGVVTGQVSDPILGQQAKVEALERLTAQLSITAQDVLAVGDGANDLGMLKRAGSGVALHAKPSVAAQCDIRINHGDLTALLFLQGYPRSAFRTAV